MERPRRAGVGYQRPAQLPADGLVVRYLFSQLDRCPAENCRGTLWAPNGTRGQVQHRYCLHCGTTWKAAAIAQEVDHGGDSTRIESL